MENASSNSRSAFTFVWTVENFTRSIELEYFISPRFLVDWSEKIMFHLAFRAMDTKPYIDCVLGAGDDSSLKDVEINCELSLIDAKGRPLVTKKGHRRPDQNYGYEFPSLVRKNVLLKRVSEFLPNDTLTFRCSLWKTGMCVELERPALCFGWSEVGNDSYFWPIERFSSLKIGQKKCFQLQPKLHVIPTLIVDLSLSSNGEYVQLEISCGNEEVYNDTKWEISLIDYEGKVFASENWNWKCGYEREVHSFPRFIKKNTLMGKKNTFLPNDVLLFRCDCTRVMSEVLFDNQVSDVKEKQRKVSGHEDQEKTLMRSSSVSVPNPCTTSRKSTSIEIESEEVFPDDDFSTHLRQDLTNLLNDDSLSDVVLQAGTETFQVHRAVLGARSSVFKEMFQNDITQIEKKVKTLDLDPETLRKLLLYIYTGDVEDLVKWNVAAELYSAASKYEMIPLKDTCIKFLMANICIANACDTLILIQHDENLKKILMEFFLDLGTEIIRSENWKPFRKCNPDLASEIMEYMYLQKVDS